MNLFHHAKKYATSTFVRCFASHSPALSNWVRSSVHELKKSRFQAYLTRLDSPDEVPGLIDNLLQEKSIKKATHPTMYAWRTATFEKGKISHLQQGSHDCREGGSGDRILTLLEQIQAINLLVVVTRWYGGTPLGPARFRCISDVSYESLEKAGIWKPHDTRGQIRDAANIILKE
ncbi:unnamed protein product [Kuraishia capsulata CBS 1993]|uniref:Impact N-terminal domain-containing protein n=1 Tax=Kuraishia capsulata CBS 1993 TaxID=1382522 RepID=W6MPS5_9ASCO|nr:uncharacterized protein KUCA_T00004703001 [Kuraishia capsulata CBS 1993]CDK28719.1 unnamed protein product [Kuraishia capsulata CBS 1993]